MPETNPTAPADEAPPAAPRRRSIPPLELVKIDGDGKVAFTGKGAIGLLVALLLTGGGSTLIANWLSDLGLASSQSVAEVAAEQSSHEALDDSRHTDVVERLDGHDQQLEGITVTIGEVQEVQHWQAADQAAERVAQDAPKVKRREAYKRLFKANLVRLKDKKLPCSNLDCTN